MGTTFFWEVMDREKVNCFARPQHTIKHPEKSPYRFLHSTNEPQGHKKNPLYDCGA